MPAAGDIEAKNFAVTRALLRKAGELGLHERGHSGSVRRPGNGQDHLRADRRIHQPAGQLLGGLQRPRGHRHAAHRLVRHGGAEAEVPAQAGDRRVDRRLCALGILLRLGRHELPHARRALAPTAGTTSLNGEKMWITNSGFADLFTVFAKVRWREVLRLPDRARHAGLFGGRRGAQAGHSRLLHLPADSGRLPGSRGEPAGRSRQGPPHRVQHSEHRPLQAGARPASAARATACRTPSAMPRSARRSARPICRIRPDPGKAGRMRRRHLRRRSAGLPHHRHDRCRAGRRGHQRAAAPRARSRSASRSTRWSAPS